MVSGYETALKINSSTVSFVDFAHWAGLIIILQLIRIALRLWPRIVCRLNLETPRRVRSIVFKTVRFKLFEWDQELETVLSFSD